MNRDCKCGGIIGGYINFNELGECCDCHKCYILIDKKWKCVPRNKFRVLYRDKLIEQQKSNK